MTIVKRLSIPAALLAAPLAALLAALLATCVSASAQQVVDGSDGALPAAEREAMMQLFREAYGEAGDVKLRRLSRAEAPNVVVICGEMSSDVAGGKYRDFRRFSVGPKAMAAFLPYNAAGEENPLMSIITTGQCK